MNQPTLTLFYDGLCPLCSREVAHYQHQARGLPVDFIDITGPQFDAARHGLDPRRVHETMHVRLGDEVLTGVDAFIAIWQTLPAYRWLARLARLPGVHGLLTLGYRAFAKIRPLLPRRRTAVCLDGTCPR